MTNNDELALKLKAAATACEQQEPLTLVVYHGKMCLRNTGGIVFTVLRDSAFPEYSEENESYARLAEAANPANILALLAERDWQEKRIEMLEKYVNERDAQNQDLLLNIGSLQQRIAELESENEYVRKRFKEVDLLFGKNLLVMKAAIIEWQSTGEAKTGLSWIFNTLLGPGELPSEEERDAQAYFDREYAPMDEELMALHKWFWERNDRIKAERAAAGIKLEVGE